MARASAMGAVFGDFNADGWPDIFVSDIYDPGDPVATGNRLLLNDGNRHFTDAGIALGVRDCYWGWGTAAADFDNDGDLDLVCVNGYAEANFTSPHTRIWRNEGSGVPMSETAAEVGLQDSEQGRGVYPLDYDLDGHEDMYVGTGRLTSTDGQPNPLFHNNGLGWPAVDVRRPVPTYMSSCPSRS